MYKVFHTGWHPGWVIYFGWNTSKSFQACPCLMYSVGATETHFIHFRYFSDMSAVDAPLSLSTNFLQFFFSCSNRPKVRSARMMSQQVFNQRMKISFLVNTTSIYKELDIETLLSQQEKGKKKKLQHSLPNWHLTVKYIFLNSSFSFREAEVLRNRTGSYRYMHCTQLTFNGVYLVLVFSFVILILIWVENSIQHHST